jgi:hypothetical protein
MTAGAGSADIGSGAASGGGGQGGSFLPGQASQNTQLTDPNSTLAAFTNQTPHSDDPILANIQAAQNAPSQMDRILSTLSSMNAQTPDFVSNVKGAYDQAFGALDNLTNQQNNVAAQNKMNIQDLFNSNLNASNSSEGALRAQRANQLATSQSLGDNQMAALNQVQSAQNAENAGMAQRLGIGANSGASQQGPGISSIIPNSATSNAIIQAAAQQKNEGESSQAGLQADLGNLQAAKNASAAQANQAQYGLTNSLQNNLGQIGMKKADMSAAEAKDLQNAVQQVYQTKLAQLSMGMTALQNERDYEVKKEIADVGTKGTGFNNAMNSQSQLDAAKTAQLLTGSSAGDAALNAANAYAQHSGVDPSALNSAFSTAQTKGSGIPGTAATISDILTNMQNNPALQGVNPNIIQSYANTALMKNAAPTVDPTLLAAIMGQ